MTPHPAHSHAEPWLADPLALASGTASRLVLAALLLAVLWGGVLWALAA
jgi:hypothetical protein